MQKQLSPFKFKIHCSQIGSIVSGKIGISEDQQKVLDKYDEKEKNFTPLSTTQETELVKLTKQKKESKITPKQQEKIDYLLEKKKTATALTETMIIDRASLIEKKKNPELPQGAKTFAERWFKEQLYMRRKTFTSKQTSKGIIVEDDAIVYIKEQLDLGFAKKNELFFENSFCCGTPDLILADEDLDAKASYDFDTFPLFVKKIEARYFWQGQGYMILTGKRKYRLCYCLMDMPEKLLDSEAAKMLKYSENVESFEDNRVIYKKDFDQIRQELEMKHYYSGLPDQLRFKVYEFEYDADCAAVIEKRVALVQKYIDEVLVPQIKPEVIEEIKSYSKAA